MPKKSSSTSPTHQTISGRIWKYGDDINTDVIFPGKYTYTLREPEEMAAHALEDLDPGFASAVQPGDVIVAGRNFGNGSSREQAVTCLRAAGIEAIVAVSFGRIYYRNAINNGLLAIVCPQAVESAEQGQSIQIDPHAHIIIISDQEIEFPALSQTAQKILSAGGLIPYVKQSLKSTAGSTG
ncbi:MAG: 3-isopropylmalate dehydratase [Anaerolineae bacterium]|nr:3-isopropylmalate dehydratase [Anaerolineae bacterium]